MSKRSGISKEDGLGIMLKKRSRISNEVVLHVELIHRIQLLLPLKEGGRTCILSKSWLDNPYANGNPIPFQIDSLASVTQLCIEGDLSFDTLESKFHLLESLTLLIVRCELRNLVFTSASLKWLTLTLNGLAPNVQVYAPKLLSFIYSGKLPGLLFRTTPSKQVKLCLFSWEYLDHSYFLKMKEALNSSSQFVIYIESCILDSLVNLNDIDVDDLKRRVLFPVKNVELELETKLDEHAWGQSRFFEAFFLIYHPSYIRCRYHVIRKTMEGNTTNQLKEVLLKNPHNGNWEALTTTEKSVLHTFTGEDPGSEETHISREAALGWTYPCRRSPLSTLSYVFVVVMD
uniref:FBD domain-containing protein n=1 Tax=Tanacetum cinerariifolium TaxID=118510 RepID=A0A6L2JMS5_TANCI|nr:hypothetical protein [Tanacetum cinerariifolium]